MTSPPHASTARWFVGIALALALTIFAVHLTFVRPYLWPAGAGLTLSRDLVFASLSAPSAVPRVRPPDIDRASGDPLIVLNVAPGGEAERAGLAPGMPLAPLPPTVDDVLRVWREAYWTGPRAPVTLAIQDAAATRSVTLQRVPVWNVTPEARSIWLREHLGRLVQMAAFLAGALTLFALGTQGMTAVLMTLALITTALANGGTLLGAEQSVPIAGSLLLLACWLATPLAFPLIGLSVLYFPTRAQILDRHRWILPALGAASAPILIISLLSAAFLLGADAVLPAVRWAATHAWTFEASFAIALAANLLIVIEGIGRFRANPDPNDRRRIQIVVFTGVPAVFAYAIQIGVPLLASMAGRRAEIPGILQAALQAIVLLPAFGLPYVVAVKHVFSPRTVLRRGLQYALARRTLSGLIALPIAALVISLFIQRDRPLADILLGQPLFYVVCVGLASMGLRFRDRAQRWLDRQFFRAEYDAREILVSVANRVPYETDPRELVAMVLTQIDSALHPELSAVLAGDSDRLEAISSMRSSPGSLDRTGGLATLLQWSDEPLEVFFDDPRSGVTRLPAADRAWLETNGVALLVPVFTGPPSASGQSTATGADTAQRRLIGLIALGHKRSEEPYTAEDRRLLSAIAGQMGVALDLSRLRRRASTAPGRPETEIDFIPTLAVDAAALVGVCPRCKRCYDLRDLRGATTPRCADDGEDLRPVVGMPPVVDGKYRIDSLIGMGGMGAVFRARDLRLERDVAIKVVRADLVAAPDARARFRREAQIVARLQHPAIVTVFDYGTLTDGGAFLVMEYVRGEDLRQVLKREETLPVERTVDLISAIALAVQAAHTLGVLHRDLKPENVLLPAGGGGPKVLDFGVAKFTDATAHGGTITEGIAILGTPAYMAPEQLRGETVDGRADVYSLGVMTFEALTGSLPFGGASFVDIGINQASGTIDQSRLPAKVGPVVVSALAYNKNQRPATPGEYARLLAL